MRPRRDPHLLVEVVGVAGAGKTTLLDALCVRSPTVRRAEPFHMRRPSHLATAVRAPATMWPLLLRRLAEPPRPSWPDVKLMLYVSGWRRFVARAGSATVPTVFDQGPIYALVRLKARAAPVTRSAAFARWWDGMLAAWARNLDIVVWLDASDDVLLARIAGRGQRHAVKDRPVTEARRFVERYRSLFDETLDRLDTLARPLIVRVDTSATSAEAAAAALDSLIGAQARVGRPDESVRWASAGAGTAVPVTARMAARIVGGTGERDR